MIVGGRAAEPGSLRTADGAELAWSAIGSGEPLVLINGYAATKADWDPAFLEYLGTSNRVVCPDNRGVGDSTAGGEPVSVERLAADVLAVMDELGLERAPVAGWSMGGFVAQTLAARFPGRVEAAILLATDPGGGLSISTDREHFLRLVDRSGTPREQAGRLISLLFPEPQASAIDAEFGDLVAAARAALDPAALEAQERLMADWHRAPSEERLAAISCPVLCAHGSADVVIPTANTVVLADRIEGAWRALFSGAGHAFMASEPARLAGLIDAFLGRMRSPSPG